MAPRTLSLRARRAIHVGGRMVSAGETVVVPVEVALLCIAAGSAEAIGADRDLIRTELVSSWLPAPRDRPAARAPFALRMSRAELAREERANTWRPIG